MNHYHFVTITADDHGRISINVEDDQGYGHGYRIAGRKFDGTGECLARRVLKADDVKQIRAYLDLWDQIQAEEA